MMFSKICSQIYQKHWSIGNSDLLRPKTSQWHRTMHLCMHWWHTYRDRLCVRTFIYGRANFKNSILVQLRREVARKCDGKPSGAPQAFQLPIKGALSPHLKRVRLLRDFYEFWRVFHHPLSLLCLSSENTLSHSNFNQLKSSKVWRTWTNS